MATTYWLSPSGILSLSDDNDLLLERSIIEELIAFDDAAPWGKAYGVWHKQLNSKTPGYGLTVLGYGTVTLRRGEKVRGIAQDNLYTGLIGVRGDGSVEHYGGWWIVIRVHEKLSLIGGMTFPEFVELLKKPRMRQKFKLPPLGG